MSTVMQKFAVSRLKDARFKPGFRTYFQDRDLGVRAATGNRYTAEIHRACAPCPQGGSGAHTHTDGTAKFPHLIETIPADTRNTRKTQHPEGQYDPFA